MLENLLEQLNIVTVKIKPFKDAGLSLRRSDLNIQRLEESARLYYLIFPREALDCEWSERLKSSRRQIIRNHLLSILPPDQIFDRHIQIVDSLILHRKAPRKNLLANYGKKLEEEFKGAICFYCGTKLTKPKAVDHIFPLSQGGEESIENLAFIHPSCNSSKSSMVLGDGIRWSSENLTEVNNRVRFYCFLRDGFQCTSNKCKKSIFTGDEIGLKPISETGVLSYDNLKTMCFSCGENESSFIRGSEYV